VTSCRCGSLSVFRRPNADLSHRAALDAAEAPACAPAAAAMSVETATTLPMVAAIRVAEMLRRKRRFLALELRTASTAQRTVTVMAVEVARFPTRSVATAVSTCWPDVTFFVFHCTCHGELVEVLINVVST
jgi:hypothetical protein